MTDEQTALVRRAVMSERCPRCDRPCATQEHYDSHPNECECEECQSLCWSEWAVDCELVDWRSRALEAEAVLKLFRHGEVEAMALVLNHEGHIERLEQQLSNERALYGIALKENAALKKDNERLGSDLGTEALAKQIAKIAKRWMDTRHEYKGSCPTWDELLEDCNCEDLQQPIKSSLTEGYKASGDPGTEAWVVVLRPKAGVPKLEKALASADGVMADLFTSQEDAERALDQRQVFPGVYDVRRVVVYWSESDE